MDTTDIEASVGDALGGIDVAGPFASGTRASREVRIVRMTWHETTGSHTNGVATRLYLTAPKCLQGGTPTRRYTGDP